MLFCLTLFFISCYVEVQQHLSIQYKWEQNESVLFPLSQLMAVFELCQYLFMKTVFPSEIFVRAA